MATRYFPFKTCRAEFSRSTEVTAAEGLPSARRSLISKRLLKLDLFADQAKVAALAGCKPALNDFMQLGSSARQSLRRRVFEFLGSVHKDAVTVERHAASLVHDASQCALHLPSSIRSFTDSYSGIQHAINGGMVRNPARPP